MTPTILALCLWAHPGADPYTSTARDAIMAKQQIPATVRVRLIERAEAHDYDDVVMIDRTSIRSSRYEYDPALADMAFGSGRRCLVVDRSAWDAHRVESAMVFCEGGWCVARPSVCNNWAIVRRIDDSVESLPGPGTSSVAESERPGDATPGRQDEPDDRGPDYAPVAQTPMPLPLVLGGSVAGVTLPCPVSAVPELPVWLAMIGGLAAIAVRRINA